MLAPAGRTPGKRLGQFCPNFSASRGRDQRLEKIAADHFLDRTTRDFLSVGTAIHDATLLVDDHHQAGRCFDQHLKFDFAPLVLRELLLADMFRLVRILDNRQIEVEETIERLNRSAQRLGRAAGGGDHEVDRAVAQPRQRRASVGGVQADFSVAKANFPAASDVVGVKLGAERIAQPTPQTRFEAFDLGRPAGNHAQRRRVLLKLVVEIVDQRGEPGPQILRHMADISGVFIGPADVAL